MAQLALMLALATPALALNPEVTQAPINETICAPGYTYTVRPSWYNSSKLKQQLLKARGETWLSATKYQLDHIVPLCLGGSPTDPSNLQLEPWKKRTEKIELKSKPCVASVPARRRSQKRSTTSQPTGKRRIISTRRWCAGRQ